MIRRLLPEPGPVESDRALEDLYAHPVARHLRVNFVASLDGAIEISGRSGPLGGPADRRAFMAMRAVADVILVGSGTANAEQYGPVRLDEQARAARLRRGRSELPRLAVVSGQGTLDPAAPMFAEGGRVLVLTTEWVKSARPDLAEVAEVVACGEQEVDADRAVRELRERGLGRILCEGGPSLTAALLSAGLVDELCLTIAPLLAGARHRNLGDSWFGGPAQFRLTALLEGDGMLLGRYVKVEG
ncbi:MAG: pyrimidine reductase family protein [Actinomycetota bacterium]|nr:pyrimidine reductase family protein [Actinomycetota bacterium]